jgi:glycosyltransferase involved in cell wall biosynthesis
LTIPKIAKITNFHHFKLMYKKIAIVHDFCFQYGGAEKVVEKFLEMYPEADLITPIFIQSKFKSSETFNNLFQSKRIKTTWLNGMFNWNNGVMLKYFKHFFWLYPLAMRFVVLRDYDVILISSTDCGKQIRFNNSPRILHYCHTPTRYLHGLTDSESYQISIFQKLLLPIFVFFLRPLDLSAVRYLNSKNCIWVANSVFVQGLIKEIYGTDSTVVYPPIEVTKYLSIERSKSILRSENEMRVVQNDRLIKKNNFYLCHGRISFHKRIDLAIKACLDLGINLKISGTSGLPQDMTDLQKIIDDSENRFPSKKGLIELLGRTTDEQVLDLITNCKGFIFPGKEDFGIAPVEMLSVGVPLIAYKAGGALEYVEDGVNGVFFTEQTVESLKEGIINFEIISSWDTDKIKNSVKIFDEENFATKINELLISQF